jgi:hypothetical protein
MISFDATPEDFALAKQIADRYVDLVGGDDEDRLARWMDIVAIHANGMPLDLKRLLATNDFNLIHDVGGIARHIDRRDDSPTGGKLAGTFGNFLPRFTLKLKEEAE